MTYLCGICCLPFTRLSAAGMVSDPSDERSWWWAITLCDDCVGWAGDLERWLGGTMSMTRYSLRNDTVRRLTERIRATVRPSYRLRWTVQS